MSDTPDTTVQQAPAPAQPAEGFIELARYNGLMRKVQELTLVNQDLNTQLGLKSSEIEQQKGQLSIKDVEKQVALGERDGSLDCGDDLLHGNRRGRAREPVAAADAARGVEQARARERLEQLLDRRLGHRGRLRQLVRVARPVPG